LECDRQNLIVDDGKDIGNDWTVEIGQDVFAEQAGQTDRQMRNEGCEARFLDLLSELTVSGIGSLGCLE
jgi:hypothetical protein